MLRRAHAQSLLGGEVNGFLRRVIRSKKFGAGRCLEDVYHQALVGTPPFMSK
jgi:hypothetical protein